VIRPAIVYPPAGSILFSKRRSIEACFGVAEEAAEKEWFVYGGKEERTSGPKGHMIPLGLVRAKARTYRPLPIGPGLPLQVFGNEFF